MMLGPVPAVPVGSAQDILEVRSAFEKDVIVDVHEETGVGPFCGEE